MARSVHSQDTLWSVSFWDIEAIVLTLGLLWLTVGTFDRCCVRIPDRPRRTSVLADGVVVLAGLGGVGGLFVGYWDVGIALWTAVVSALAIRTLVRSKSREPSRPRNEVQQQEPAGATPERVAGEEPGIRVTWHSGQV